MNALGQKEIGYYFPKYIEDYQRLEHEYLHIRRIPIYYFIKSMINLHRRHKLTDAYQEKMRQWDI